MIFKRLRRALRIHWRTLRGRTPIQQLQEVISQALQPFGLFHDHEHMLRACFAVEVAVIESFGHHRQTLVDVGFGQGLSVKKGHGRPHMVVTQVILGDTYTINFPISRAWDRSWK